MLTAADIPGKNDIAPAFADEPLFADDEILFHGQALFAVVGDAPATRRGAPRGWPRSTSRRRTPAITVADALATGARVLPDYAYGRGDVEARARRRAASARRRSSRIGGQEHFYLEGQASLAMPGEGGEMTVHASTQDPTEVQHIVARVLGVAGRLRHRRDAAHGRRLRRQGEPGLRLGGDRRARRARSPAARASSGSTATTISC